MSQINITPTYYSTKIAKPDTFKAFSSNIELAKEIADHAMTSFKNNKINKVYFLNESP